MSTSKKNTEPLASEGAPEKPKRARATAKKSGESQAATADTTPRKSRKKKSETADAAAVAELTPLEAQASKEVETAPAKAAPVKTQEIAQAPMLQDTPLGTLSAEADTKTEIETRATEPPIQPEPKHEPLHLARGAFIALRKSGGLSFSSREVVVYPDGRVAYDARGVSQKDYNRLPRGLNDGQVHSLRKLLDHVNFWHAETTGEQNPDAYAYEITARLGQRSNSIQVFDGSIPENLKPLLERLTPLLPRE